MPGTATFCIAPLAAELAVGSAASLFASVAASSAARMAASLFASFAALFAASLAAWLAASVFAWLLPCWLPRWKPAWLPRVLPCRLPHWLQRWPLWRRPRGLQWQEPSTHELSLSPGHGPSYYVPSPNNACTQGVVLLTERSGHGCRFRRLVAACHRPSLPVAAPRLLSIDGTTYIA